MRLRDSYDGSNALFQGDRTALLQSIPAGARIERATVTVTPVDATRGVEPFAETITFDGASGSDTWGATKTVVPGAGGWVEVDFHARRTLVGVSGVNLSGTTLQVDFGGVYVELNPAGGVRTPNDATPFTVQADAPRLPGLTVTKIKLTNTGAKNTTPDLTQVTFRSLPSNVTLRLGESAPFWARVGELVAPETTPDFALLLQAFLAKAESENGFLRVPLVAHTDTLARLSLSLKADYLIEQSLLPPGLREVTLPFDLSTRPNVPREVLQIAVPAGARVARRGASARVNGVFEPTRLVRETETRAAPVGTVEVSPALSHAQPIKLGGEAVASAVDLLLTVNRPARLQLDIREDFDDKPGPASLLPAPAALALPGPVGLAPERRAEGETSWLSVSLPADLQFKAGETYWLVLQCLEGVFGWNVAPAPAGAVTLQHTDNGGLSWRADTRASTGEPLRASFRLRRRPDTFEVPIELEIGEGEEAVRLNMDRFQPLGRVDFELDPDDLSGALNQYLDKKARKGSSAGVDHLANGDFEQWLRVGDVPRLLAPIPLDRLPTSLAFAPDGSWAYVGLADDDGRTGFLRVVDVACGALVEPEIALDLTPDTLVLSPDGTRAYVTDGRMLQVIDATTHRSIGTIKAASDHGSESIKSLAVSPDGARLYAALRHLPVTAGFSTTFDIASVDAVRLEQALTHGLREGLGGGDANRSVKGIPSESVVLAVSPDGGRLYATTVEQKTRRSDLRILDAHTLQFPGESIPLGREATAIALSADGKRAVVVNAGDNTLTVIDTVTRTAVATRTLYPPTANIQTYAVALSPEGARAYVAGRRAGGEADVLSVVSLDRGGVETISLGRFQTAFALTAQGDHLLVADALSNTSPPSSPPAKDALLPIQIGLRLPAEWDLTSGMVSPLCYPAPYHLVARLGPLPHTDLQGPTTVSQVVPVSELGPYDFTFEALASRQSAVAEVFWIKDDCGLLRTDTVEVEALTPPSEMLSPELSSAILKKGLEEEKPRLTLHRRRLNAPAGATQAEVRFNVPRGVVALVGSVSLAGTDEALENKDLSLLSEGQPKGWRMLPAVAPGVSLSAVGGEIQMRNNGGAPAELVQEVTVKGNSPFALTFRGRTEARPTARGNPSLELRWLKDDGSPAGASVTLNLSPEGFDSGAANGTTPPGAARGEIHLIVPAGTSQNIRDISLQFLPVTNVPVTFVAQAPGELSLFDWRIAFEEVKATKPPIPDKGLCVATPPGRTPGKAHDDGHYCPQCGLDQPADEPTPARSGAGRPASVEKCSVCGTKSVRAGGRTVLGAKSIATHLPPARAAAVVHAEHAPPSASKEGAEGAAGHPLTAVVGIGPVRAAKLAALGVDSLEMLAAATPEDVMRITSVTFKLAADFIEQAKGLLAQGGDV